MLLPYPANGQRFGVIRLPFLEVALPQEVLVVEQQFLQAGAGDVDQAEFGLRGGSGGADCLRRYSADR